jgi:hypothetical protein
MNYQPSAVLNDQSIKQAFQGIPLLSFNLVYIKMKTRLIKQKKTRLECRLATRYMTMASPAH